MVVHLLFPLALSGLVLVSLRSIMITRLPLPAVVLVMLAPMYSMLLLAKWKRAAGLFVCGCIVFVQVAALAALASMPLVDLSAALKEFVGVGMRKIAIGYLILGAILGYQPISARVRIVVATAASLVRLLTCGIIYARISDASALTMLFPGSVGTFLLGIMLSLYASGPQRSVNFPLCGPCSHGLLRALCCRPLAHRRPPGWHGRGSSPSDWGANAPLLVRAPRSRCPAAAGGPSRLWWPSRFGQHDGSFRQFQRRQQLRQWSQHLPQPCQRGNQRHNHYAGFHDAAAQQRQHQRSGVSLDVQLRNAKPPRDRQGAR